MKHKLLKTMLLLCVLVAGSGTMWGADVETTYTFSSKSWAASPANWTGTKDGNQFNTSGTPKGVQVCTGQSGVVVTSPKSFTKVKQVVVTYSSSSKGVGSIEVKVGSTSLGSQSISKSQTEKALTYSASNLDGSVSITCTCTTNSLGINSVKIVEQGDVPITSISFDKNEATVGVGGTVTITPTISPTGYTETPVWESDDTDIATVSNGVVTGVAAGSALITLTSPTNASIYDVCEVTVTAAVSVTGVTLSETSKALHPGDEFDLTATVAPNNATNKAVTWTSSNDALATVDNGHVIAIAAGTPTITVTTVDGSFTATCTLNITNVAVTGVTLDQDEASIYTGSVGNTVQLTATVAPANATNKAVTWTSSNTSVATVSSTGLVTSVAAGSATITATTTDGSYTATCDITVENGPGTAENPYTIAEAKAAIDASGATDGVYVHGVIAQVDSYSSNTITYWISDDGTTTNMFEVYKGKGLNNANFTAKSDLEVGDIVTVYGDITLYNSSIYEFSTGNYITYFKRKTDSDLTVTSSTPVALERTSAQPSPTSTITWTTTSTGAITCTSSDETVATVTNAGVITAVGEGSATITISQVADDDYKAGEKTVTVNVTDNRSACATGIDLSSAKTITKGDGPIALSASSTKADGFTGEITYSYVSANSSIFSIADGKYTGAGVGATTVTVTATPTGGNAANYKPASQEVAVTVNGTNSISLDPTSKNVTYGADAFTITATVPTENYDGTVTASSSNTNVATVSVDGTTVTVTPGAAGTATITVTAGTDTYYLATASETCAVTVTAPEGSEEAPESDVTYTFDFTDNTNWGFPTTAKTGEKTYTYDGKTVTLNTPDELNGYKYNTSTSALLIGKEGATLTLPAFDKPVTQIDIKGPSGASGKVTQNIFVGSTAVSTETTGATGTNEYAIASAYQAAGTIYTLKVTNANNTQISKLTVHMYQAPNASVTLNTSGYATYCSVNPMDFSSTEGYTAWRVSDIAANGTITFTKITEKIKGGQGVLLFNKDADGVNTSNVTVNFANGSTVFTSSENKLIGTTAPTYVDAETVYGLSNNKFVKNSAAGNIPAGKAYLDASSIPAGVKAFTFVFEDEADGIAETRQATREEVEAIFNLAGQRIQKMQKGINIVNGKKVLR